MWGYTLSTPEMYKSGDRSLANRPTQIVSVSKSYLVNRWNTVLCLQKAPCSRPDRCHRHCFSRRLGEHFILVYYRSAWLDTGGPLPKIFFETLWHLSSVSYLVCWYHFFFSFFFFFFFFFREGPRIEEHFHRIEKGEEVDLLTEICPKSYIFHLGRLCARTRACVCVCVCVCVFHNGKKKCQTSTASDTSNTSSKQQQAQRKKKKLIYNSKRPVSSVEHCHPYRTEKRRILLNPHMSQSTCFGTLIKTGVDCKEDTGSQGQCRQQRRREKVKWRWLSNTSVWPPRLQTLRNNSHDRCVPTRACTQEEYKQN